MDEYIEPVEDICMHTADEYEKHLGAVITPLFQNPLLPNRAQK